MSKNGMKMPKVVEPRPALDADIDDDDSDDDDDDADQVGTLENESAAVITDENGAGATANMTGGILDEEAEEMFDLEATESESAENEVSEEEAEEEDAFSELFRFALPNAESSEKYVELSPIEQARQHRRDFDLKIPKCILKQTEIEQLFTVFDLIDTKNSGYIGSRAVMMVFRAMGIEPSPADVTTAIRAVSKQKEGKVTFEEFLSLIKNKVEERDDLEGLRKGFESLDFRKRKVITAKELKIAAKLLGENLEREEGEEMIKQSDKDGDGVINFDDFCKTINKLNIFL